MSAMDDFLRGQNALRLALEKSDILGTFARASEQSEIARIAQSYQHELTGVNDAFGAFKDGIAALAAQGNPFPDVDATWREAMSAITAHRDAFRFLENGEAERLARAVHDALTGARETEMLRNAMEAMHSPWLSIEDSMGSASAFAEMQMLGRSLREHLPYEGTLPDELRISLGDWRDLITAPTFATLSDPASRSRFYAEQGFNKALTAFTPAAFHEGVKIAGLTEDDDSEADEDNTGYARSRAAFVQLQRFEIAVRKFILRVMQEAYGDRWIYQLPPGMYESWMQKKRAALAAGQPELHVIEFSDFADYKLIIERRDNWKTVFKGIFGRTEDIRESFQRLFPVRNTTMHSRMVTLDDEMLLIVETKRILKAINPYLA